MVQQFHSCCSITRLQPHGLQHTRLPCPSPSPRVCSNSRPLSWGCRPTISSSVTLFSSCPQFLPASGSFLMSQLFTSDGQNIRALVSASVLTMNIQGWFPLGLTGLISLPSKGLSGVFSSTTVQRHQFVGAEPSLQISSLTTVCDHWEDHSLNDFYPHYPRYTRGQWG